MPKHAAEHRGGRIRRRLDKHNYLDMTLSERFVNSHWPFTILLTFWLVVAAWSGFHVVDAVTPYAWVVLLGIACVGTITTSMIGNTYLNQLGWRRGYLRGLEWQRLNTLPEDHPDRLEHLKNVKEFK